MDGKVGTVGISHYAQVSGFLSFKIIFTSFYLTILKDAEVIEHCLATHFRMP